MGSARTGPCRILYLGRVLCSRPTSRRDTHEESIANQMPSKLPQWQRVSLVAGLIVLAAALGLFAYSYVTRPLTLTVAVGSPDEEVVRRMSAIASGLATTGSNIRLKVIDTGSALEAAKEMAAGRVDLAVLRDDIPDLSDVRTVLLMTHGVALILVPSGSSIDSVPALKGKTVGVVGAEINHRIVDALVREYALTGSKVQFKDIALAEARKALEARQVQALLVVLPITERNLALVRGLFPGGGKLKPKLIPIDAAGAIEAIDKSYESYELPKGTLQGSPPVPDDDMTTLRVPIYLVANKTLADDKVTELTRAIMETRRDLLNAFPILSQISAPDTDKDDIPSHSPRCRRVFCRQRADLFRQIWRCNILRLIGTWFTDIAGGSGLAVHGVRPRHSKAPPAGDAVCPRRSHPGGSDSVRSLAGRGGYRRHPKIRIGETRPWRP